MSKEIGVRLFDGGQKRGGRHRRGCSLFLWVAMVLLYASRCVIIAKAPEDNDRSSRAHIRVVNGTIRESVLTMSGSRASSDRLVSFRRVMFFAESSHLFHEERDAQKIDLDTFASFALECPKGHRYETYTRIGKEEIMFRRERAEIAVPDWGRGQRVAGLTPVDDPFEDDEKKRKLLDPRDAFVRFFVLDSFRKNANSEIFPDISWSQCIISMNSTVPSIDSTRSKIVRIVFNDNASFPTSPGSKRVPHSTTTIPRKRAQRLAQAFLHSGMSSNDDNSQDEIRVNERVFSENDVSKGGNTMEYSADCVAHPNILKGDADVFALLEEKGVGSLPGLMDMLMPILEPMLSPVGSMVGGLLSVTLEPLVKSSMGLQIGPGLGDKVPRIVKHQLADELTTSLIGPVSQSVSATLSETVTNSLRDYLTHGMTHRIGKQLLPRVSKSLRETIPQEIDEVTSPAIARRLTATLSRILVRSLTQSVVPTLVHAMSHSPLQDYYCYYCYHHGVYCSYCHYAPIQLYYAMYYTEYYSKWYSDVGFANAKTAERREQERQQRTSPFGRR